MTKKVQKKSKAKKAELQTKFDEELQEFAGNFIKSTKFSTHPKTVISEFSKAMHEYQDAKGKKDKADKLEVFNEKYGTAIYVHALDNHSAVAETVSKRYQPLVVQMSLDIKKEFDCTTAHEKALAELIASSYVRYIQYSGQFRSAQHMEWLSSEKVGFYSMFSKEADKAHRQFTTALTVLKQLKSPTPQINVKSNTAFVAQNQQVNAVKEEKLERKKL